MAADGIAMRRPSDVRRHSKEEPSSPLLGSVGGIVDGMDDRGATPLLAPSEADERVPRRMCVPTCVDPAHGGGWLGPYSAADLWSFVAPESAWSLLPILAWLPRYTRSRFIRDLAAGLTVGVMLIPQSMAYSNLAGLPAIYGLYASTVSLFAYAIFASSTKLQVGTVATTAILLNTVTTSLHPADVGGPDFIRLAIGVSFVAGCVQVAMGLLRFGFVARFLSWPVMSGFTSAAACIILVSQLKDVFGLTLKKGESTFVSEVARTVDALPQFHWPTFVLSVAALAFLVGVKSIRVGGRPIPRWFPAQLLLVVASILCSYYFDMAAVHGVKIVGEVPAGFPSAGLPVASWSEFVTMLPGAVILSIVSYVGAISLSVVFAKEAGEAVNANLELVGLGAACMVGAVWQGQLVSGSFTRTAVNNEMGSTSPMAVICTGALMVLSLMVLAPLFQYLPKAVLACMIISSLKSLFKAREVMVFWRGNTQDLLQLVFCFFAVLLLGIDKGIVAAMGVSVALVVLRSFRPAVTVLGRLPHADGAWVDVQRYPAAVTTPGVVVVRVAGEVHFGNQASVAEALVGIVGGLGGGDSRPGALSPAGGAGGGVASTSTSTSTSTTAVAVSAAVVDVAAVPPLLTTGADDATTGTAIPPKSDAVTPAGGVRRRRESSPAHASSSPSSASSKCMVSASAADPTGGGGGLGAASEPLPDLVVLDGSSVPAIDGSGCQAVVEVLAVYCKRRVPLLFAGFCGDVRDTLERFGVGSGRGPPVRHFMSVAAAVRSVDALPVQWPPSQ